MNSDRRTLLKALGGLGAASTAGCTTNTMTSPDTEPPDSSINQKAREYGWPPNVPKKPDRPNMQRWNAEFLLYYWMTAAHTQQINEQMQTQTELLREIRDELQSQ